MFRGRLICLFLLAPLTAAQTCYWPDKSVAEDLRSCNSQAENSHCCGPESICLSNGYCFNQESRYGNRVSRGGCTDNTWNSKACPQYCQTALSNGSISISLVTENDAGSSFCCGVTYDTSTQLCRMNSTEGNPRPFTLDTGLIILNQTSGSTKATSSGNTTAPSAASASDSQVTIGAAVGAGVGASLGVLVLGAAMFAVWHSRRHPPRHAFQPLDHGKASPSPPMPQARFGYQAPPSELQSNSVLELESRQ